MLDGAALVSVLPSHGVALASEEACSRPNALSTPPAWVADSVQRVDAQGLLWLQTIYLTHAMLPSPARGVFWASAPFLPPFVLEHGSGLSQAWLAQ